MALSLLPLAVLLTTPEDSWTFWRHRQSCDRKVPYFTEADAQAVLASWRSGDMTLQAYGCTACGWFHLGRYAGGGDD